MRNIPCVLRFMCTNNTEEVVTLQEGACGGIREEVAASSDMVVNEPFVRRFRTKVFQWICPEKIAHQARSWRLTEAIDLHGYFS